MEANKRNINQAINPVKSQSNPVSDQKSTTTLSGQYQYQQNKQLILIQTKETNESDTCNNLKRPHSMSAENGTVLDEIKVESTEVDAKKTCIGLLDNASTVSDEKIADSNTLVKTDKETTTKSNSPIIKVNAILSPASVEDSSAPNESFKVSAFYCKLCAVILNDDQSIRQHLFTLVHRKNVNLNVNK